MTTGKRIGTILTLAFVLMAVLVPLAQATYPKSQLGILTREILDGDNPATGEPWADGDTYRLVFYTSGKMTAESSDISVYNDFIQTLADATTLYDIGADEGVTWKVIGSTREVDARDNTLTNPEDPNHHSGPIFLLDGSTLVATDNADLWDGEIENVINITENGSAPDYFWPCTGTYWDGTMAPGHGGSNGALGDSGEIQQGNSEVVTHWIWRVNTSGTTKPRPLYAMSDPLVITGDPELPGVIGGDNWITWSGKEVELDTTVTNNDFSQPQDDLIYDWSADEISSADDNLDIVITPKADPADATVSITKKVATGDITTVKITLAVTLPGKKPVRAHMTIDVHDTACKASIDLGMATFESGDLNKDCYTNLLDFAMIAEQWLVDYKITAPTAKDVLAAD